MNRLDNIYHDEIGPPAGWIVCPDCNGHGRIDTGGSLPWGEWVTIGCGLCDGLGIVKEEV